MKKKPDHTSGSYLDVEMEVHQLIVSMSFHLSTMSEYLKLFIDIVIQFVAKNYLPFCHLYY